ILLYALKHPIFVIDAYTYRVLTRHYLIDEVADYDLMQEWMGTHVDEEFLKGMEQALATPSNSEANLSAVFNEFHALLVNVGKDFCKPAPRCEECPLKGLNW